MSLSLLKGYSSNSASPTDIWELIDDDTKEIYIAKIYVRKYLSVKGNMITHPPSLLLDSEAAIYTLLKERVDPTNACFFIKFAGSVLFDTPRLANCVYAAVGDPGLMYRNLYNNTMYMLGVTKKLGRKSITDGSGPISYANALKYKKEVEEFQRRKMEFGAIFTEKLEQVTLNEYLKNAVGGPKSRIIGLVVYAVYVLSTLGINQNDLHWGNILVQKDKLQVPFFVLFQNKVYRYETPDLPVIYDFDRAVVKGERPNAELEKYKHGGNCPSFHRNRDVFKAICIMSKDYGAIDKLEEFLGPKLTAEFSASPNCWLSTGRDSLYCSDADLDNIKSEPFIKACLKQGCAGAEELKSLDRDHPWVQEIKSEIDSKFWLGSGKDITQKKRFAFTNRFKCVQGGPECKFISKLCRLIYA